MVLQAAFTVVLLMGAGLMVRTIENLQRIDLGFDPVDRVKVSLGFPIDYPSDGELRLQSLHEMQERLQRVPGVASAEFGNDTVTSGGLYDTYTLESTDGRRVRGGLGCSSREYLKSLGVTSKRGRWFAGSQGGEVLVNESLARALWPGKDPIGQILRETPGVGDGTVKWFGHPVVGVVGDVRSSLRGGVLFGHRLHGSTRMGWIEFVIICAIRGEKDWAFSAWDKQ
ncbi:MAG TPA: hypothetical protein VHE13_11895 [Opitutus sp.]|nr:hypothetical protein [Opitutus sp.]